MCQRVREADPTSSGERQESQRQDKQNNWEGTQQYNYYTP